MKMYKRIGSLIFFLVLATTVMYAQSWREVLKSQNNSHSDAGVDNTDFIGKWNYVGSAIAFKSNDYLKKAGGAVAAAQIKTKFDEQLAKFGVKPGTVNFMFANDNTFTCLMDGKYLKGTYKYSPATKTVAITFLGFLSIDAAVNNSKNKKTLLFDADKLLVLLAYLGERGNNPTFKAIGAIASTYDGMLMGLEIKK